MDDMDRYSAAAHAVQSGIAMKIELDPKFATPKDLRTGIDTSKSDIAGLANLLIAKGIFTEEEYTAALANAMEEEKARWENEISRLLGGKAVKLV